MEKIKLKIKNWIKNNSKEFWILVAILILSAFLRLYKIDQYMTFLGDEGRDVIVVHRFLTEFHPPLIGPGTSVGNMYLGPMYYYMMAPALLIANFSPVGPAVQIAILGVITVFFIWYAGRKWFGNITGLTAAFLYSISPTVINFSRSSWNPNIMPFFALLSIWSIWKVWNDRNYKWMIVLGFSFAAVLQSHYLGLLLIPTLFIFWLLSRPPVRYTVYASTIFLALMSPLLIFDLRHHWQNFLAMKAFIVSGHDIGFSLSMYLGRLFSISQMLFADLVVGKEMYLGVITILISIVFIFLFFKNKLITKSYWLVLVWLALGLLGLALYRGSIYDHYLEFIFPVTFLFVGMIAQFVLKSRYLVFKILLAIFIGYVTFISFKNDPPIVDPVQQLPRSISVARVIQEKANGQRFNLATISDFNNRDVYEYFLLIWGTKIVDTDPSSLQFTVTDQLFVVCEFPREKCNPIHDASAWITNFGWTKITDEWPVWGGTLFKLGHSK